MKSIERRLAELERRMVGGEIICCLANGTKRSVRGKRLIEMLCEMSQGILRPDTEIVLNAVSDNCLEAGYGYMGNLLRVMWAGAQNIARLTPEEVAILDASE